MPSHYLRAAFENADVAMLVVTREGGILDANRAFGNLAEIVPEEIVGTPLTGVLASTASGENGTDWRVLRPGGPSLAVRVRRYPCRANDEECELLVISMDSESSDCVLRFERDPLTGLPNRAYFDRRLTAALEAGAPFALLFLDLDDFKPVNDQLGHAAGDHVLTAVAQRLAADIRPGDVLSRRGGDEFTLLLPGVTTAEEARQIAERLWQHSQAPLEVDGRLLAVGVSIGVAFADGSVRDPDTLLAAADRAMYIAKRRGAPILAGDA
jgi:diguanylate cyclase (GGDEF)-like protein